MRNLGKRHPKPYIFLLRHRSFKYAGYTGGRTGHMNSECPYVADTDKGGHMSLPIQLNGPPHVLSMNVTRGIL